MTTTADIKDVVLSSRLKKAAEQAVTICLDTTADDRAVIIYDHSASVVAAALLEAFEAVGASVGVLNLDQIASRPFNQAPVQLLQALDDATVSALAAESMRGELTARRTLLDLVALKSLRHAHMPSITPAIFEDGLAMDYRKVAQFIRQLVLRFETTDSVTMTSQGGTDLEFRFAEAPEIIQLDGLIKPGIWQNLPSGQIVIVPQSANGTYIVDSSVGDWFEHKYDVSQYPVSLEFERGHVRQISCSNTTLERELGLYLRSSDNSGRISELTIGANLYLTQHHRSALFDGYRPGASISVGDSGVYTKPKNWSATTFTPMIGQQVSLTLPSGQLMRDDRFVDELLPAG